MSKTDQVPPSQIILIPARPKLFDENKHAVFVHFRVNNKTNQLEIIINRACSTCKIFKKLGKTKEICIKCKYEKFWLERGLK